MPLSGRDRRHFRRELDRARGVYESATKQAAEAREEAAAAMRRANRMECDAWNARIFLGGEEEPSPTIAEAINAGAELLEVKCPRCGHADRVDLTEVIWPREKPVSTLRQALACRPCRETERRTSRPMLVALLGRPQDPEGGPTARVAR